MDERNTALEFRPDAYGVHKHLYTALLKFPETLLVYMCPSESCVIFVPLDSAFCENLYYLQLAMIHGPKVSPIAIFLIENLNAGANFV